MTEHLFASKYHCTRINFLYWEYFCYNSECNHIILLRYKLKWPNICLLSTFNFPFVDARTAIYDRWNCKLIGDWLNLYSLQVPVANITFRWD